jgi:hypothetical protein
MRGREEEKDGQHDAGSGPSWVHTCQLTLHAINKHGLQHAHEFYTIIL